MACKGLIIKGIGGFYYVKTASGTTYACKARGLFRKKDTAPLAGDYVTFDSDEENGEGYITEIAPRKNQFTRPAVANIDVMVIVVSAVSPLPNLQVIDKMTAIAAYKDIPTILVFTKGDLEDASDTAAIYQKAGFPVFMVDNLTGEGAGEVRDYLKGKFAAFSGNTGVGKSSLLNAMYPGLELGTGEISQKLGRGRHTTRSVELFPTEGGGYIADTPGFSTVDVLRYEHISAEELDTAFPDFLPYREQCKFTGCAHLTDKGCAVTPTVEQGLIGLSRYNSYKAMYSEVKDLKDWMTKK